MICSQLYIINLMLNRYAYYYLLSNKNSLGLISKSFQTHILNLSCQVKILKMMHFIKITGICNILGEGSNPVFFDTFDIFPLIDIANLTQKKINFNLHKHMLRTWNLSSWVSCRWNPIPICKINILFLWKWKPKLFCVHIWGIINLDIDLKCQVQWDD